MTLNITLLTPFAIYQSADFRLTDPLAGSLVRDESAKTVVLQYMSWSGFVTYTGLGSCNRTNISDFVAEWLEGTHGFSMAEVAARIEDKGTHLLNRVRKPNGSRFEHTFTLAGFENGFVRAFVISNFEDAYGRMRSTVDSKLTTIPRELDATSRAEVIVTGKAPAVSHNDRRDLCKIATTLAEDGGLIRRRMQKMNAVASAKPESDGAVSQDCAVFSFRCDGSGKVQMSEGLGPKKFPVVMNGVNMAKFMAGVGIDLSNAQVDSMSFASTTAPGPENLLRSTCRFTIAGTELSGGYEIQEIAHPDFETRTANDINEVGHIVGTGREELTEPWTKNIPWIFRDGEVVKLQYDGFACCINEEGLIAAMPQGQSGDGVAIYSDGRIFVFPIEGADVDSVAATTSSGGNAINAAGIVAGNVCTQTGHNMRAAVFRKSQPPLVLTEVAQEGGTRAVDINNRGQVLVLANVGPFQARSILWDIEDNTWSYVGSDSADVLPVSIANDGSVLGSTRGENALALLCKPGSTWEPLGTPDGWSPLDINDTGDVVGTVRQDGLSRPWVRLATGEQFLLPYIIGHDTEAKAINNAGDIVGAAYADHGGHAVVWRRG